MQVSHSALCDAICLFRVYFFAYHCTIVFFSFFLFPKGPFTALLPTNIAFDDVDEDLLDELLDPANIDDLQNFLLYHILPGATRTTEFTAGPTDTLFRGNQVEVRVEPIQFDQANVLAPDIVACNGYIDIIGSVLNPFEGRKFIPQAMFLLDPSLKKMPSFCAHSILIRLKQQQQVLLRPARQPIPFQT